MNAKLLLKTIFFILILLLLVLMGMHNRGAVDFTLPPLIAKVIKVEDLYVELELAPNVKVRAVKTSIGDVLSPTGSKPAND